MLKTTIRAALAALALAGLPLPAFAAGGPAGAVAADEPTPAGPRTFGSLTLQPCPEGGGYCGTLPRKLDPSGRVKGGFPSPSASISTPGPAAPPA